MCNVHEDVVSFVKMSDISDESVTSVNVPVKVAEAPSAVSVLLLPSTVA